MAAPPDEAEPRCRRCGEHVQLCLRDGWNALGYSDDVFILRFCCDAFAVVVELPPAAGGAWRLLTAIDDEIFESLAEGDARQRLDAIGSVARALHARGYFAGVTTDALAASMAVAIASPRQRGPQEATRDPLPLHRRPAPAPDTLAD